MKTVVVTTQADLDALPKSFDEYTMIEIRGGADRISIKAVRGGHAEVWGGHAVVRGGHAEVRGGTAVVRGGTAVVRGESAVVTLLWLAICIRYAGNVIKKSPKAQIIEATTQGAADTPEWLVMQGVDVVDGMCIVYKRVSKGWQTQEGTKNETIWKPGAKLVHPDWDPEGAECGEGKYHACPVPHLADEFRSTEGDRYVAIRVKVEDLHAWTDNPKNPDKIAFRAGEVLYECDRYGKEIKP